MNEWLNQSTNKQPNKQTNKQTKRTTFIRPAIYDWAQGRLVGSAPCSKNHLNGICFARHTPLARTPAGPARRSQPWTLVTCGRTLRFWNLTGEDLSSQRGMWGETARSSSVVCLAAVGDYVVSGTVSGLIDRIAM